jgi:hypothetical protein
MRASLEKSRASTLAIYTQSERSEQIQYAREVASVFAETGWTLAERNDHEQERMPPRVNLLEKPPKGEKSGISMLFMKGGEVPTRIVTDQAMAPVIAALQAAHIKHQYVEYPYTPFNGEIKTALPVLWIGPIKDP